MPFKVDKQKEAQFCDELSQIKEKLSHKSAYFVCDTNADIVYISKSNKGLKCGGAGTNLSHLCDTSGTLLSSFFEKRKNTSVHLSEKEFLILDFVSENLVCAYVINFCEDDFNLPDTALTKAAGFLDIADKVLSQSKDEHDLYLKEMLSKMTLHFMSLLKLSQNIYEFEYIPSVDIVKLTRLCVQYIDSYVKSLGASVSFEYGDVFAVKMSARRYTALVSLVVNMLLRISVDRSVKVKVCQQTFGKVDICFETHRSQGAKEEFYPAFIYKMCSTFGYAAKYDFDENTNVQRFILCLNEEKLCDEFVRTSAREQKFYEISDFAAQMQNLIFVI